MSFNNVQENSKLSRLTRQAERSIYRGEGLPVTSNMSVSDMLKEADLDWEVLQTPFHCGNDLEYRFYSYRPLITPNGELLGVVSQDWAKKMLTFEQIATMFKSFADSNGLEIERFGALRVETVEDTPIGKETNIKLTVFASAPINSQFDLGDGDITEGKIILSAPFVYGQGYKVSIMADRLICTNGMVRPVALKSKILTHTSQIVLSRLKEMLEGAKNSWADYEAQSRSLARTHLTQLEAMLSLVAQFAKTKANQVLAKSLLEKMLNGTMSESAASNLIWDQLKLDNESKIVQICFSMFCNGTFTGGDTTAAKNTAYGLLQVVTEVYNHEHATKQAASHLNSLWFGTKQTQASSFMDSLSAIARVKQGVSVSV